MPNIERAYLLIQGIEKDNFNLGNPLKPVIRITFRNYGRTPANVAKLIMWVRILDHIPTDADIPKGTGAPGEEVEIFIAADKIWTTPWGSSEDKLDNPTAIKLRAGEMHLYCWGRLEYRCIFGKINPTNFCRRYNSVTQNFSPVGGFERNKAT